ncbi:vang-like protein 1 [Eurytemora carolleeae]|uniref:vang-like protein 1 n=1 Tax=Eurytemora carolleeae TaxID=1294199 RepID=UPI000C7873E8|nr:vang-like protein 1 [Eurytemora carolleeae]|eukprot:XP_023337277.1 vang-like protein 1 [Eurytemora affinis]
MPYLLTSTPGNPTNWVKMETESILSGHSVKSSRSNYGRLNPTTTLPAKSNLSVSNFPNLPPLPPVPGNLTSLSNYSLSRNINNLNSVNNYHQFTPFNNSNIQQSPYHASVVSVPMQSRYHNTQVNILPTVDDWADNTTALSGMSDVELETSLPNRGLLEYQSSLGFQVQRFAGHYITIFLSILSFISPILMLILPQFSIFNLRNSQLKCDVECDGFLISFTFKLLCLSIGSWAVFYRKPKSTMPRLLLFRGLVCLLMFVLCLAFWLFYGVRIMEERRKVQYADIVRYSGSYLDSLLVLHYLALLLVELRHNQTTYLLRVVRSPDGESGGYPLGQMSIQQAASTVLDRYIYIHIQQAGIRDNREYGGRSEYVARDNYKFYDVDGFGNYHDKDSRVSSPGFRSRKDFGHNDLFYEEYEYERRLKKRRARLITATEEAFSHIKRVNTDSVKGPSTPMDSYEAAQTIFPSIVRPLQKYLRITRQQPRHTMDSILTHLATTITYDMAPKAFLEKYLITRPVLQNEREQCEIQSWSLVSEVMVSRGVEGGTVFLLRQGEISLLCEVLPLPHYSITETVHNPGMDKFIINRDNNV